MRSARILLAGIETIHMMRKEQLKHPKGQAFAMILPDANIYSY